MAAINSHKQPKIENQSQFIKAKLKDYNRQFGLFTILEWLHIIKYKGQMSNPHPATQQFNTIFKEEDFGDLIKSSLQDKNYHFDKTTRKILAELAQTFLEEALDLTSLQKRDLSIQTINRQLAIKFPEIARGVQSIEMQQKRNKEIDKEALL